MKIGMDQYNTFDTMSMDCWMDRVYFEGKEFPVGYFAAEILNFAGTLRDPLLERITSLTELADKLSASGKDNGLEILAQLKPLLHDAVSWICTCPPFCYCDNKAAHDQLAYALDADRFEQESAEAPEQLPHSLLSVCEPVLRILVAIYNFCLLIRLFEQQYLRRLKQRTASAFAKAAHECFDADDSFLVLLEQMPFGEVEEFFSFPRIITGFTYFQDENDKDEWKTAQRVVCKRTIDFYVFDLLNGLQHGHAPSRCRGCGKYFLTTNGHIPKYCDGIAPQDSRYTCRQYGAMMRQKEQNRQHPIYRLFTTRTGTIRKHYQRGKISADVRREALYLAERYRDKALMDSGYAADGYAQDMEPEHIYAEAEKRLTKKKGVGIPVPKNMYTAAGDYPGNEELALQIQAGDRHAAELLISQNEGYLTKLTRAYTPQCEPEDLKQEGALALLDAAARFDPAYGTKLLTYATPMIEAAMTDYAAQNFSALSVPVSRYNQLRKAARLCAEAQDTSGARLDKASEALRNEYRTLFFVRQLGDDVFSVSCGGDPAAAYDRRMRNALLLRRMEEVLFPRELNLVCSYLGIGQPDDTGMTFQELAIRLNYNGPSGAEKAYKTALRKLKKELYSGAYGRWRAAQRAIRMARAEAASDPGHYTTPQTTWLDEKALAERFIREAAALARVHEIFCGALCGNAQYD